MSLNTDDVQRIASLARMAITAEEEAHTLQQLNAIFGLIATLRQVDTEAVAPMAHALDVAQRLREDTVTEQDQHQAFQALAPQVAQGYYLVPKVIE